MQVLSTCVIVALAVAGVSASPHRDRYRPSRPVISVHKPQVNMCGNGVSPYCCDNAAEGNQRGGEVDCKPLDQSGNCDTTIVCCNSQDSTSTCLGNVDLTKNSWTHGL